MKYISLRVIIFMMKGTSVITRFSRRDGGVDFYNENFCGASGCRLQVVIIFVVTLLIFRYLLLCDFQVFP